MSSEKKEIARNDIPPASGFFSRLSIRGKLLGVMMIVTIFALFMTSGTLITFQWLAFRSWTVQNYSAQVKIVADNSRSSLTFDDADDALDVLRSLEAIETITAASIYDVTGKEFAGWVRAGYEKLPAFAINDKNPAVEKTTGIFTQQIVLGETPIGMVVLRSSQKDIIRFLQQSIFTSIVLVILTFLATLYLSLWLQKIISKPIVHLACVMKEVESSQDYGLRAERVSSDELGDLAGYFNTMLARIETKNLELHEQERLLSGVINNTSSLISLKRKDGTYILTNAAFCSHMGLEDCTQIKGKSDAEMFGDGGMQQSRGHDKLVLSCGELMEFEEVMEHPDSIHTYISVKFPLKNEDNEVTAVCTIATDITDRKKAEKELRQLRNYLANVIDSMPSALIGVDISGTITQWNNNAEKLTKCSAAEALGANVEKILPLLKGEGGTIRKAIATRTPQEFRKTRVSTDQGIFYYDITLYPLVGNGIQGAVIRVDDVSERIRLEDMMVQSEKMMSVGGLAAGMAHEINNPLGIILQAAQNIHRRCSEDLPANCTTALECETDINTIREYLTRRRVFRFVDDIQTAGQRAAEIVKNMLQFSRRSDPVYQIVSVADLIDKTLQLAANDYDLKTNYDFKHINIVREYGENVPPLQLQATEFEQVILNLVKNAAQAMGAGTESDQLPQLILRVIGKEKYVQVEVEDNGPGMDEAVQKRVFEPFFTTKSVGSGTGLGLSVSYMIVTGNLNGTMHVESSPGMGSKFIIHLSLERNV